MTKKKMPLRIRVAPSARRDIRKILSWSFEHFGAIAEERYRQLIVRALHDVEIDPMRPESKLRPELGEGFRTYHLGLSRRAIESMRVRAPRHFIVCRIGAASLEVRRVLHDSRDLPRHLLDDVNV